MIKEFNLDNSYDYWSQVIRNEKKSSIPGQFFGMQQFLLIKVYQ